MKFMLLVKASEASESGQMPAAELIDQMMRFNEEMIQAGVLIGLNGLQCSSTGARVDFSGGGVTVTDGPFVETKELIGGYWLIEVANRAEAIEWAKRSPAPHGPNVEGQIEVRQVFDPADFDGAVDPEANVRVAAGVSKG